MFWVWLARAWLQGGLGSQSGLTVEALVYGCVCMQCSLAAGISQPLCEPTTAVWLDQGKERRVNKKPGKNSEGKEMCCIQTTE